MNTSATTPCRPVSELYRKRSRTVYDEEGEEGKEMDIHLEMKKTNKLLTEVVNLLKRTESRVDALEEKFATSSVSSSSSCSTPQQTKKVVPLHVRVSINVPGTLL